MPLRAKISPSFLQRYFTGAEAAPEVKFHSLKASRTVTLNRPNKLNSLNLNMVEEILPRLQEWEKSDAAKLVVLKGEGEKSLCAGGDVAALASGIANEGEAGSKKATHYFEREYILDQYIATYPKPFVALQDGITMGGGVGLSVHAPFRIATEKTMFAMPETNIGFFPDVGGTFFLSRLDGELGVYLGLTSERLKGFDALYAGVATHYVPSNRLPDLEARLAELTHPRGVDSSSEVDLYTVINNVIEEFCEPFPQDYAFSLSGEKRKVIDTCFAHDSVEEILTALSNHPSEFAQKTKETISKRSPTSVKVALAAIRRAKQNDFTANITGEYHLAEHFMYHPDFVEGVSALLLTKPSREPKWTPAQLADVKDADVASFFSKKPGTNAGDIKFLTKKTFKEYPHNFGLPSEQEIKDYVLGNNSTREFKATRQEVLDHFADLYKGKLGLEYKVNEVLSRKTTPDSSDPSLLDWVY
ncbi:hypothetical protein TRICI_001989 [Trichomonascus ciferrii]|uniref:3-hydroxyisobutyryl-CoA hydrolase n=1 Tax=Trichomonascus ciferrii TaxID=44093 RepID=A0A642VCA4_9ASCO|nr:hypothetical protein TRICI_001989 [Trichomonascus ciferrii]